MLEGQPDAALSEASVNAPVAVHHCCGLGAVAVCYLQCETTAIHRESRHETDFGGHQPRATALSACDC